MNETRSEQQTGHQVREIEGALWSPVFETFVASLLNNTSTQLWHR